MRTRLQHDCTRLCFAVIVTVVPILAGAQTPTPDPAVSIAAGAKAQFILERLTGTRFSPDSEAFRRTAEAVEKGDLTAAAREATSQPQFLNVTVRQMAAEMSTREETLRLPFNDFIAGIMGVTRDGYDARTLLTGNFYYVGNPAAITGVPSVLGPDILASNNHYQSLQTKGYNLGAILMRVEGQRVVINDNNDTGPNPDPAGVLTSRTFLQAHAKDGTNRRLVEFTFREFMCVGIQEWSDAGAPDIRIGRDIDRFPGGDNTVYQTTCKACHTVMDGFRGAFAYWDFPNDVAVNSKSGGTGKGSAQASRTTGVMNKMNKNNTVFPGGYTMTDNSWVNNAIRTGNAGLFGWRRVAATGGGDGSQGGSGVNALGNAIANSQRFSQCMAQRVFKTVCKKDLTPEQLAAVSSRLGGQFETQGYNLRRLFEMTAIDSQCQP